MNYVKNYLNYNNINTYFLCNYALSWDVFNVLPTQNKYGLIYYKQNNHLG